MKIEEIPEKFIRRGRNIVKKAIFSLVDEYEYRVKGMPTEERDVMIRYLKSRRAKRYLSTYANERIRRVVIQIGMDKTASTSIQSFLHQNQDLLQQHSIEFRADWGSDNHSIPLKSMVAEEPEKIYHHIVSNLSRKEIEEYNAKNLRILCQGIKGSEEETYVFFGEGICSFRKVEYKTLQNMLAVLMPNAAVEILYCARSNVGYASSAYQQAVKMGRYHDINDQIWRYSQLYKKRLKNAIKAFGKEKISVYQFEDTVKHPFGPVGYFMEKLGVDAEALRPLEMTRVNESVSYQAIEIMADINEKCPMTIGEVKNPLRQRMDMDPILKISGPRYHISNDLANRILQAAMKDIVWLEENFACAYPRVHETVKEPALNYDARYYEECISAFGDLNPVMKQHFYAFIVDKHGAVTDPCQRELFKKLETKMGRELK
jgi:hypothetical protein